MVAEPLREWLERTEVALAAIPRVETRELTIVGGAVDTLVALSIAPDAVLIGRVLETKRPGVAVAPAVNLDWAPAVGGVVIRSFSGLTADTVYTVTLIVFGDS